MCVDVTIKPGRGITKRDKIKLKQLKIEQIKVGVS